MYVGVQINLVQKALVTACETQHEDTMTGFLRLHCDTLASLDCMVVVVVAATERGEEGKGRRGEG